MLHRIVAAAALLVGAVVLFTAVETLLVSPADLDRGFAMPIMALEFATSPEQVHQAVAALAPDGDGFAKARADLRQDDRVIIPVYVLLLIGVGFVLGRSVPDRGLRYAWMVGGLALLAGVFDYAENAALRQVLSAVEAGGASPNFGALVGAATTKWLALAGCMAVIGLGLAATRRSPWAALLPLATAIVWAVSLVVAPLRPGVEWGFLLFGAALMAVGWVLWRLPSEPA